MTWPVCPIPDFFAANPSRIYRLRMATPLEIAALDPAPDQHHFVYVIKCRHLPRMTAVFEGDVSPLPGEFGAEDIAKELWQGTLERGGSCACYGPEP